MRNAASREEHLIGGIKRTPLLVALTQLSVEMVGVAHTVVAGDRRWVDRLPMVLGRNDAPSGQFIAEANATNDDKRASKRHKMSCRISIRNEMNPCVDDLSA